MSDRDSICDTAANFVAPSAVNGTLFNALTGLIGRMPQGLGYALATALTPVHYHLFGTRRRAVMSNLAVASPSSSPSQIRRTARAVMRNYNHMLFEFFRLPRMTAEDLDRCVEIIGLQHIEASRALGRGVIVTSCHIGNWELGAVQLARRGHPVTAVAGAQFGRWLAADVRAAKERLAVNTVAPEDGFRRLWRALARNEAVALMVDGDIFSAGNKNEFLGRQTAWPAGPGALSARTGAPIVAAFCERLQPGRFRIRFEEPLDPSQHSAESLNAAVAGISSEHVRTHLDQWCIFRDFWPAPEAEIRPAPVKVRVQA